MFGLHDAHLSGWGIAETGELFRGLPIAAEDVVVDVGCGDGGYLAFCADRGAHVVGIDLDEAALQRTRSRVADLPARAQDFHVAPAESLPLPDGFATVVLCTEVLEHVADPAAVLAELNRIGAPGARYLITVPDALQERLQQPIADDYYFQPPNHIRIIERDELPALVQSAGLEVLSQDSYGFFWSIWWALFWGCDTPLDNPQHPALDHWTAAWAELIKSDKGRAVKAELDRFLPKSQIVLARKPVR
jgi:SAM-dependent methyltransferase